MNMELKQLSLHNNGMSQDKAISAEDNKYAYKNRNIRIISPTDNTMQIVTNYRGGKKLTKTANIQVPADSILMNIDLSIYKNGVDTGTVVNANCIIPNATNVSTSINVSMMMQKQIPMYFTCSSMMVNESFDYGKIPGFNTKYYVLSLGNKLTISNESKYANSIVNNSYNAENDLYVYSGVGAKFIIRNLYVNTGTTPVTLVNANAIAGTLLTSCITPDYLVIFAKDGNTDKIYRITLDELVKGDYTLRTLYSGTELNFHTDRYYDTVYYEENANVKKIYWCESWKESETDNNKLRFINLVTEGERYGGTKFTRYTENKFEFYPLIDKAPRVKIQKLYNQDSDLPAGVIQYFITYYNENGAETKVCQDTSLIALHPKDRGSKEDEKGNCVIQISISEYSTDFDYIRIYSAARSTLNGSISAHIVADLKIPDSGGELSFIDNYKGQETIQDTQLFFIGGTALCANTIDEKQGTLFAGNVYTEQIMIPQDIKNLFVPGGKYIDKYYWSKIIKFSRKGQVYIQQDVIHDSHSLLWWDEKIPTISGRYDREFDIKNGNPIFSEGAEMNKGYTFVDDLLDKNLADLTGIQKTAYKQTDYSYCSNSIYQYALSSNFTKSRYLGFKFGEIYRFGLQFQNTLGEWTEVLYIGDGECRCSPGVDEDTKSIMYTNVVVKLPTELKELCKKYSYINYRLVFADPETGNGRQIIAQGILCPTVFSPLQRYMKVNWVSPSWIFRPIGGDVPYRHFQRMASYWYRTSEIASTKGNETVFSKPNEEVTKEETSKDEETTIKENTEATNKCNVLITLINPYGTDVSKKVRVCLINCTIPKAKWYGNQTSLSGFESLKETDIENLCIAHEMGDTWGSLGSTWSKCYKKICDETGGKYIPSTNFIDGAYYNNISADNMHEARDIFQVGANGSFTLPDAKRRFIQHLINAFYHGNYENLEKLKNYEYIFNDNREDGEKSFLKLLSNLISNADKPATMSDNAIKYVQQICCKRYGKYPYETNSGYKFCELLATFATNKLYILPTTKPANIFNDWFDVLNNDWFLGEDYLSYKGFSIFFNKWKKENNTNSNPFSTGGDAVILNISVSEFTSDQKNEVLPETEQITTYVNNDTYFVDNSIVTFNSPDITDLQSANGSSLNLSIVGASYIKNSYGKRTIELSNVGRSPNAEINNYNAETYIGNNVTKTLLSEYCINDNFLQKITIKEVDNNVLRDDKTTNFMTHMWEMGGSITGVTQNDSNLKWKIVANKSYQPFNDDNNPLVTDYAVIKYNKTYNYKFAEITQYVVGKPDNIYQTGTITISNGDTANNLDTKYFGAYIYNGDVNKIILKKEDIKYVTNDNTTEYLNEEPYTSSKTNQNKDGSKIFVHTDNPITKKEDIKKAETVELSIAKNDTSNAFKKSNTRITYKETPHAVFSLGHKGNKIQLLPIINKTDVFDNDLLYCGGDNENFYNESIAISNYPWAINTFDNKDLVDTSALKIKTQVPCLVCYDNLGEKFEKELTRCISNEVKGMDYTPDTKRVKDPPKSVYSLLTDSNSPFPAAFYSLLYNSRKEEKIINTYYNDNRRIVEFKIDPSKQFVNFYLISEIKINECSFDKQLTDGKNTCRVNYSCVCWLLSAYIEKICRVETDSSVQYSFGYNPNTCFYTYSKNYNYNGTICKLKYNGSLKKCEFSNINAYVNVYVALAESTYADNTPSFDTGVPLKEFLKSSSTQNVFGLNTLTPVPNQDNPKFGNAYLDNTISANSNKPILLIGELKRNLDRNTLYGGFSEQALQKLTWLPASNYTPIDNIIYQSWGDTYFQRYDCLKTYPRSEEDMNQVTDIASVMIETHQNLDTRTDVNRWNFNTMARPDNFGLYNSVYNQKDNLFTGSVLPELMNFRAYNNMIVWSNTKNIAGTIDSWTNLSLNSYAKTREAVTKIVNYNENLFVFEPNYIERIIYKDTNLVNTDSANSPIRVDFNDKVVVLPWLESYGSNNPNVLVTQAGLYYVDDERRTIYRIGLGNNQLTPTPIGKDLIQGFFNENITKYSGNRQFSSDIRFYYDVLNKEVFIMLGDKYCVVYNETLDTCISFLDCNTELMGMFTKNNKTFAFKNGTRSTWNNPSIYEMYVGKYNQFFDTYLPYEIEYRVNTSPLDTVYTNIEFLADLGTSKDNSTKNEDIPFKTVQVYNEYQDTGTVTLTYDRYKSSNLKQKFRTWRAVIPRSKTGSGRDRIRNPWIHLVLKNDPRKDVRLDLHSMIVDCYV